MGLFHVFTEMFNNQEDAPILESECKHTNSTGECSLIQRLKELQTQKKDVDKQIKKYEGNNCILTPKFIELLALLERQGCFVYCDYRRRWSDRCGIRQYIEDCGVYELENVIGSFSKNDIQKICNELNTLSDKANIIAEKRELSNKLADEIKEIKNTLGIE